MSFRVVVDFDRCESNALCMAAAPEVFEVRDDDFLYVLQENPPDDLRAKCEEDHDLGYAFLKRFATLTAQRLQAVPPEGAGVSPGVEPLFDVGGRVITLGHLEQLRPTWSTSPSRPRTALRQPPHSSPGEAHR